MNFVASLLIAACVWLGLCCQARASGAYADYAELLGSLEIHQLRQPDRPVRIGHDPLGTTLEGALQADRAKAAIAEYLEMTKRGDAGPDLIKLVQRLTARYRKAFLAEPQAFEREYLGTFEVGVEVMSAVAAALPQFVQKPPGGPTATKEASDMQGAAMALQDMLKAARVGLISTRLQIPLELRRLVAKGMFSEPAAQRALALAARLELSLIDGAAVNAPADPPQPPTPSNLMARGARTYVAHCVTCHGEKGQGTAAAKALDRSFVVLDKDPSAFLRVMLAGSPNRQMPSWHLLSDFDMAAVMTYVQNQWSNRTGRVFAPEDIANARDPSR